MFCKKGALRNFAKFTEKHLRQSLFFNKENGEKPNPKEMWNMGLIRISKVSKLQAEACNFIKKEALAQVFSCEFCEISKNTFSYRTPPVAASEL